MDQGSADAGGTIDSCAAGPTAWNTWLTCEEDFADFTEEGGKRHGFVFEVFDIDGQTSGNPIVGMGRINHQAVALDTITGPIFLTEDDRNQAGLYKFIPANTVRRIGALQQAGTLFMASIAGEHKAYLLDPSIGQRFQIEWFEIAEPDLDPQPFTEPSHDGDNLA